GVWVAIRRQRLLAAWAACAAAGLALATHTTGFVGLAPLLAGLGGLWALVRAPGGGPAAGSWTAGSWTAGSWTAGWSTAARAVAVVSGGTTAALAGFADGSLRDFLRAQQIFLDIQPREYWYTEHLRWFFLLGDSAMGNYAKRVAVLVAVVALVWFLALSAATRVLAQHGRGEPLPAGLRLAGWSLIASFGLLWLTPSKWTHHFGALAGVGPVFLTLLLVAAVPLAQAVFRGTRLPTPVLAAAAGSALLVLALAGHGRNVWPYAWLAGFADVNKPPDVGPFTFGSVLSWAVVLAGCVLASRLWTGRFWTGRLWNGRVWTGRHGRRPASTPDGDRWRPAVLRGVTLFVVAGLLLNVVYLLGSFALAARNTAGGSAAAQSWSLWGADVSDPGAIRCGAADAVSVYDPFNARPLDEVAVPDPHTELESSAAAGSAAGSGDPPGTSGSPTGAPSDGSNTDAGSGTASSSTGAGSSSTASSGTASSGTRRARIRGRAGEPSGFERAGGYYVGYQPPVQLGTGAASTVWGSLVASEGKAPDRTTGEMRTPWYRLPTGLGADQALAVLLAGSPNQGNSLTAEYAAIQGGRVVHVGMGAAPSPADAAQTGTQSQTAAQRDPSQRDNGQLDPAGGHTGDLDDNARDPRWRSVLLHPPHGAQLVRLHAVDDSAGAGGWLAFAAPAVQHLAPLRTVLAPVLGKDRAVALAWQIAFQYPCLRQPRIRDGITEPPAAAVLWADQPFAGTRDGSWLPFRGGIHGRVLRSQAVLQLTARVRGMPAERRMEVLVFDTRLASDAYFLTTGERRTDGWAQPVPTPTRTLNELERCVQNAAATAQPAAAARCVPKPVP
ncbi:MAG: arabinosyltransferase domain-containing protein, partial [Pseudonocardia sp.]